MTAPDIIVALPCVAVFLLGGLLALHELDRLIECVQEEQRLDALWEDVDTEPAADRPALRVVA